MSAGIKYHRVTAFFDSSSAHKLPHIGGPLVKEAMAFVNFDPQKPLSFHRGLKLVSDFDIPYLLGYDTKSPIAYGDRDFDPTSYSEGDATFPLLSHEQIEKALEEFPTPWNYEQRHHVATHCENVIVDALGWDWRAYSRWATENWHKSYIKWRGPVSNLRVPATLDMSPYVDEHEEILKKMRQAGAKDEGRE